MQSTAAPAYRRPISSWMNAGSASPSGTHGLSTQSAPAISRVQGRPAAASRTCSARTSAGAGVGSTVGQATAVAITSRTAADPATSAVCRGRAFGGSGGGGPADVSPQAEDLTIAHSFVVRASPGARLAEANRGR
ncbi:hypothetical protein Asi02nite_35620 [Asanoa siamensis]|uniref:Uncharacterized protein n=1 Tax=Asanoa siamensis TaxID=926357 RepID=A0ABQ4CRX4_9ACTN|nr:hypothetical protein Asi02nite_35620 [Asanoa siamensis]